MTLNKHGYRHFFLQSLCFIVPTLVLGPFAKAKEIRLSK
jgi:hypothetical protein